MSEDKEADGEVFYKNKWVKIRNNKDKKTEAYIDDKWITIEETGIDNFIKGCSSHDKETALKGLKEYGSER